MAAVSVSGLKSRMVEKKEFLIEKVLETGKLITKEIGGEYPSIINNQTIGVENVI